MYYEENYMAYIEDGRGCCGLLMFNLRRKRHLIVIILLLILAIVCVVAGLYNGFTLKKYSDLAIFVGIFFPSIILVFICIYLAFICGREFRSPVLSRRSSDVNNSHHSLDASLHPQTNSAIHKNLRVRYQPKVNTESINGPVATRNEEPHRNKTFYTTNDSAEATISRRNFRSFSNSDISRQKHRNYDMLARKPEMFNDSCRGTDNRQYSPRFRRHQDVTQNKEFKRSISDTANKNRNTKSREDKSVWNTQSLENFRRRVDQLNSVKHVESGCNSIKFDKGAIKKATDTSHLSKNFKTTEEYEKATRFKECEDGVRRYSNRREEHVPQEDIRKKSGNTKSEVHLYSSSVLKLPYEYKQTFHFSSFLPARKDIKDMEDASNCSSVGDQRSGSSFKSNSPEMKNREGVKNSSSEQDTYDLKRKTVYFPAKSSKESTRPSRGYAHENCRYSKEDSKMPQKPLSRNEEEFEDHQWDKPVRFHWR